MELQTGSVVEFVDKGRHRLALITRVETKKKRLRLLVEDGREVSIASKQITLTPSLSLPPQASNTETAAALVRLREQAVAAHADGDPEFLWELAAEEHGYGAKLQVEQLTEMIFGDDAPLNGLATALFLREHDLYFKPRKDEFELRNPEQVEQLSIARRVANERAAGARDFVACVSSIMDEPIEARDDLTNQALEEDAEFARRFARMRTYAMQGDDADEASDSDELLDAIEAETSYRFDGRGAIRAFDLLVQLGHWHRDENLTLLRHQTPIDFPPEALAQAEALHDGELDPRGRLDLTDLLSFSIDDSETRDIDDALSIEPLPDGGWRVGIHIADPASFVPLGSPLDLAARRRGTTLYLPTGNIPMFPPSLSEGLFSLIAGERRAALSFLVDLNAFLEVIDSRVIPSIVQIDERLTYEDASQRIEFGEDPVARALRELYTITEMLTVNRQNAGAAQIHIPDVKVRVSSEGEVTVKRGPEHSFSHELVSELMILANTTAARFCRERHVPVLFRTQDPPSPPLDDPALLALPEGLPRAFASMRRMRPANNSVDPAPHAGLGVDAYVQATSPIRRYSDFITHAQLRGVLLDEAPALDAAAFSEIITIADANAGDARHVSRDTDRYWTLRYLEQHRGQPLTATIIEYPDALNDRASVVLNETILRATVATRKRLPIGSQIPLSVTRCYPRAGYLQLQMIETHDD